MSSGQVIVVDVVPFPFFLSRFGPYATTESRVNLLCKNDPTAQNEFMIVNEDNLVRARKIS